VRFCEKNGLALDEPTDEQYLSVSPRLTAGLRASLTVEASLNARSSPGGTAPERVTEQLSALAKRVRDLTPIDRQAK
jgi:argininosuccinate lyase